MRCLTAETVESAALSLEGVDNIHGCDSLSLGVLGVGNGITNDVFQENLEDTTGFFVDQARDTLDTTTTSQTADSGLCDTLDVITKNFTMTLGATLSKTFTAFTASRHVELKCFEVNWRKSKTKLNDVSHFGRGFYTEKHKWEELVAVSWLRA